MTFAFIQAEKGVWPIAVQCEVLEVSRSGFYAWQARKPSARQVEDARITEAVEESHKRSRETYGSPRIHRVLRSRGIRVGRKRIARLMRESGLHAKRRRRFRTTTNSKHSLPVAPNLLRRDFRATHPNQVWVTDVTCVWTWQGWLYLAVMLDLFSRKVVGWATSESNDTVLALEALNKAALRRRPPRGVIHHSDRGSPYASQQYVQKLAHLGMSPSMSRKGDCWDNAVAESFFATLKGELTDHEVYSTRLIATQSIGEFIEHFYNNERLHSTVGYVSPTVCELVYHSTTEAA